MICYVDLVQSNYVTSYQFPEFMQASWYSRLQKDLIIFDICFMQIKGHGDFVVDVVDSVNDYVQLMKEIFDFEALRRMFVDNGIKVLIDSMSGGEFF